MEPTEEQMEAYLDMKEQAALEMYRKNAGETFLRFPRPIKDSIEDAFLIGYSYGGIEHENDLREVQKSDPLVFYKWIQEGME